MSIDNKLLEAITSERAVLFLGAGAIASSTLKNGNKSPLGSELSQLVYEHFYPKEEYEWESLAQVSSMVQSQFGQAKLHQFFLELFDEIEPSKGLRNLSKIKWSSIYTTNIDRALEVAYNRENDRAQELKPVVATNDLGPNDQSTQLGLYKIHGCISKPDVPMVFSLEDYANYKDDHLKLFNKLSIDLVDKPIIFIGYSMVDSNFQEMWATLEKHCSITSIPDRYYFVGPKIKASLKGYLESKGFHCIEKDLDGFSSHLQNLSAGRRVTLRDFFDTNSLKLEIFKKIKLDVKHRYNLSRNYYFPSVEINRNYELNKSFYKGAFPQWADIKHNLDAKRDLLDDLIFNFDAWSSNQKLNFWLISGRTGDGKSTLLKRLAVEISNLFGESVIFAKSRADLDPEDIIELSVKSDLPVVLFLDNAVDRITKINNLIGAFRAKKIKALIIGAARTSDLHSTMHDFYIKPIEYKLQQLSDEEINSIISKLEIHDSLIKLADLEPTDRFKLFKEKSDRELLVAMREATMGVSFEELIASEYTAIKNDLAKNVFRHVCFIHQFRYRIPQSLLIRVLQLEPTEISKTVFKYTKDVLFFDDDLDGSDYLMRSRHAVIASTVVKFYFNDEVEKVDFLKDIFHLHIPSNPHEKSLIKKLYHHSTISELFEEIETGSNCYDILIKLIPDDPYLIQQKALYLANYSDNYEDAVETIKEAVRLNPQSNVLHHTHGTILMKQSISEEEFEKATYYLEEAKRILIRGARKNKNNIYNYHTLISYLINWAKKYPDNNEHLIEEIQSLIEEATRKNPNDTLLLTEYGKIYELLADPDKAVSYFEKAISINHRNSAARYLLARVLISQDKLKDALKICNEGVELVDDEIYLNRIRFELMHKIGELTFDSLTKEYSRYIAKNPKDSYLKLCYAAYLYVNGDNSCDKIFSQLRYSEIMSYYDKIKIAYDIPRFISAQDMEETGQVERIIPSGYYIKSERFNTRTFVFLSNNQLQVQKNSQRIRYRLSYNYLGPHAHLPKLLE